MTFSMMFDIVCALGLAYAGTSLVLVYLVRSAYSVRNRAETKYLDAANRHRYCTCRIYQRKKCKTWKQIEHFGDIIKAQDKKLDTYARIYRYLWIK